MERNINNQNDDVAIQINGLVVRYRVPDEKISGIKEYVDKMISHKLQYKEFLALNDLNLTIKKGERVGIIGHNGAGKSTLLKVIARVIKPSEGEIEINGSIAPLLELGAGFDLELTGEQNIYLNGSILGKSKKYLNMIKEEIIEFAELGEFINYPVKNYSSGMRAKLGFAIASQVDSDILLVDEVFGVGDENFKRKSKAKMVELINSGKTVVIVSHDMTQMVDLTERVIWMNNGRIVADGSPQEICDQYCAYMLEHQNVVVENRKARTVITDIRKKKRKEEGEKNKTVKWAKKTGVWDKMLSDPATIKELVYDNRVMRNIQKDRGVVESILESEEAIKTILENEFIMNEILQSDVVREEIEENPYLYVVPEKKLSRVWGNIDECIYYTVNGLLYIKGWHMPVDAYTDVKIYMAGELLGDAQLRLNRTGVNRSSENSLDRFPGWEFIKEVSITCSDLDIFVLYNGNIVWKENVKVKYVEDNVTKDILWKNKNRYTQEICWDIFQRYVVNSFNLLSFQKKKVYNSILEKDEKMGCLYRKHFKSAENEFGFKMEINRLGLRGPADSSAQNIVIGGTRGLGFGVDQDRTWFAHEFFDKNWINLCCTSEPSQLRNLLTENVNCKKRTIVILYEATFWDMAISKGMMRDKDVNLSVDGMFVKEQESFYDFYNKMYYGIFKIVEGDKSLINCKYAQFDFEKNRERCINVVHEWYEILKPFKRVIALRIPNKEYICAANLIDSSLIDLKKNQDYGWNLFVEGMSQISNIEFLEIDDFELSDFLFASGFLNEKGNEKLRNWIMKSVR